jgi:hypothetical protein
MRVGAMSDEDSRSGDFLARWSRRKQEARAGQAAPGPEQLIEGKGPAPACAEEPSKPDTDLSNLPPIDSIDAATDIRAFLRKGIPQDLSHAALRRAWATDPAIREFVGLAENAWDFNDPNAMPGFGPLDYSTEQIDALVRRVIGDVVQATESLSDPGAETAGPSADGSAELAQASNSADGIVNSELPGESGPAEQHSDSVASQSTDAAYSENEAIPVRRRTHGSALPR